jgi:hypothetical protein
MKQPWAIIRGDQWKIVILLASFSSFSDTIMLPFGKSVSKTQQYHIVELHSHFGVQFHHLKCFLEEPNETLKCVNLVWHTHVSLPHPEKIIYYKKKFTLISAIYSPCIECTSQSFSVYPEGNVHCPLTYTEKIISMYFSIIYYNIVIWVVKLLRM